MPLTEFASFRAKLQRNNRIVVPKNYRWQYKMEKGEVLSVTINPLEQQGFEKEVFLAKMASDGRLTVPKLTMQILQQQEEKDLTGCIFEVEIRPASSRS